MPSHRASWAEHGEEGWYIGPARDHYQCYQVLIKRTRGVINPPSLKFFPEKSKMPSNSSTDRMIYATKQLTEALNNPSPPVPYKHDGNEETTALTKLAEIFSKRANNRITSQKVNKSQKALAPSQRVSAPSQRLVTPRQKTILRNAIQQVSVKKRRKKLAEELVKAIQHKLSRYRSPILKKKQVTQKKVYTLRKRKTINYKSKMSNQYKSEK